MASITVDGIVKTFGGQQVLRNLSLHIPDGAFYTLLGPSGCGKTTLLRCIAGFYAPDGGRLLFDKDDVTHVSAHRRDIGMVFQDYALFPDKTAFDNVAYGLRARGVGRAEIARRVNEALDKVGLQALAERFPAQMSGGQRQRVALARALVIRPRVLLMDEPLSNLDAKLRIEMRAEIRRIHRQLERATIYVTHDQDEALSMADRIVVMRAGSVQQIGAPREVYGRPRNLHVARFMGYRNVLDFRVVRQAGDSLSIERHQVQLNGTAVGDLAGRQEVAVAMRPDDFQIAAEGQANGIDATVRTLEFGGRDSLLFVSTALGDLYVRLPGAFAPGDHIRLHIPADRVLAYAEAA